jgi:LPXTG-motif cell wall-anchored protein
MKYGVGDNKSNVKVTDVKRRYRMYKDGKKWVIAAAAAAGFILGPALMSSSASFAADTTPIVQTQYDKAEVDAGAFIVAGTATDATGDTVSGLDAYISIRTADGTEIGVATLGTDGTYSIDIPLTKANYGTKIGVYTVYIDGSGESKSKEVVVPYAKPGQPAATATAKTDGSGTTVNGTANPSAHIDIKDGGVVVATGTADGDGHYSIDVPYDKAKQGDPIEVSQTTPGGESDPTPATVPYTAPAAPTLGAVRVPGGSNTTVSGSGEPGATVSVTDGSGKVVGTGTVDENGHYLIAVPLTDAPAGTDLTATQTLHNLPSPASNSAQVPYDKPSAPQASISKPAGGVVTVTGTAEPGAKVTLTPANGSPITTTADGDGKFTALVPESSAPQNSNINVTQTTNGGESDPTPLTVPYETPAKPDVTLGTPTETDQPVSGKADPGADVTITPVVDGKAGTPVTTKADENGDFSTNVPTSDAPEGATISTTQTTPGGVSPANEVDVPYTKPGEPDVTVGAPENGDVPISGSGKPGDTVTITPENGTPITVPIGDDGKFKAEIPENEAKPGDEIKVVENGKGGSSDPVTKEVPQAKPDAPTVDLGKPTDGKIHVTGDGEPNATVTVTPDGGTPVTTTADDKGHFETDIPESEAPSGTAVTTTQETPGGVSDPATDEVPYNAPAKPDVKVGAPEGGSVTVSGTGEPGDNVTVTPEGGTPVTVPVGDDGKFKVQIPEGEAQPGKDVTVVETGKGGSSEPVTETVPEAKPDAPDVEVGKPTDGKVPVSGEAKPGAEVTVTPEGGTPVTTTADENGHFETDVPESEAPSGTKITTTQKTPGGESDPTTDEVPYNAPDKPDVTVGAPEDGNVPVSGTGTPGDTVTITPEGGKPVTVPVGDDGKFKAQIPEGEAQPGKGVTVVETGKGGDSEPVTETVPEPKPDAPDVEVGKPTDGKVAVTGDVNPGAEVTVTPEGGTPVTTTADENGHFAVDVPESEAPSGTKITTTQKTPGGESDPTTDEVPYNAPDKPDVTVGAPEDGNVPVSGTGTPGDTVTITPEGGKPVTVPVGDDGKFKAQIPEGEAQPGKGVTVVETGKGGDSEPVTETVPEPKPDAPEVEVGKPTDGKVPVSGEAKPGAEVTVTPEGGTPVTTTADENGHFATDIPESEAPSGSKITTTQKTPGGESDPTTDEVPYNAPDKPDVTVGAPEDGNVPVSGTGTPGDTVTITPEGGKPVTVPVGDDGKFKAQIPEGEAQPGKGVTVVETGKGGDSEPVTETVPEPKPDAPTTEVGKPTDGKVPVSGEAKPGAEVTITPEGGTPVTTTADENGHFATDIPESEAPSGTKITTTQKTPGGESDPTTDEVPYNAPATPEVTVGAPVNGSVPVSGTGTPGDTVTITPEGGKPVTVPVGDDGKFKAQIPEDEAQPGSDITVVETGKGGDSTPATETVPYAVPDAPKTTVAAPEDGTVHVTGTAEPGASIKVTPSNGSAVTGTADDQGNYAIDLPETSAPSGSDVQTTQTTQGGESAPDTDTIPYPKPVAQQPTIDAPKDGKVHITGTGTPGDTISLIPETGGQISVPVGDDGTYDITVPESKMPANSTIGVTETGKGGTSDRIDAKVPLAIPDAPLGKAESPKNAKVHLTGTAEAGAEVTLTTDSGVTQTLTADDQGNFAADFDVADAPIGSHINATQKTAGGVSDANAIEVPKRPDLNAPDASITLTKPEMDGNIGNQGQARLRSAKPLILHVHGYTMSTTGAVPHATMNIYKDDGTFLATVESDDTGYYNVDIPLGVLHEGDRYYGETVYEGMTSERNYKTVPYAQPVEPVIGEITNDGTTITIKGHSVKGNMISVKGTTDDENSPSAIAGENGDFVLMIPVSFATPGTELQVYATNHTAVGPDMAVTIPEVTDPEGGSETGTDGGETTGTETETKPETKIAEGEGLSVKAEDFYDNTKTPETQPETKIAEGEGLSVKAEDFYDNTKTPETQPETKIAEGEGLSVKAEDFYDNTKTPETQPETKVATGDALSVKAEDFYNNTDTPTTGTTTTTTQPETKTATGEALSITPAGYFDNSKQPAGGNTTATVTVNTPSTTTTATTQPTTGTTATTTGTTTVNTTSTQPGVSTATTQPSTTSTAVTLPDTMGETTATTTKGTDVASTTTTPAKETTTRVVLPSTGNFDDEGTQTVAAGTQSGATKSAAQTPATTSAKQTANALPSTGQSTLPQTGDRDNSTLSIVGLALAAAMGILGIFGIRKRHED